MTFGFSLPGALITLWFIGFTLIVVMTWRTRRKRLRVRGAATSAYRRVHWQFVRHLGLIVTCTLIAVTPQIGKESTTEVSSTEVYLLVDTTGSMGALDYGGPGVPLGEEAPSDKSAKKWGAVPRIDGVRKDILELIGVAGSVRYSVITTERISHVDIPLTSDNRAVERWIQHKNVEDTATSAGSSLDRAFGKLLKSLQNSSKRNIHGKRLLFVFSDGERTVDPKTLREQPHWDEIAPFLSGGAVFQYGTESGARMPYQDQFALEDDADGGSAEETKFILDPDTDQPAISKADPKRLKDLAGELGLPFYDQNAGRSMKKIIGDLESGDRQILQEQPVMEYRDFVWPLVIVLAILVIFEAAAYVNLYRRMRRAHVFKN
ncbi:MAG: VWA domain-containing protein [Eubacteriales bacterium]|nr:VWA domain-containing protein [Eubacteriales bacterium]